MLPDFFKEVISLSFLNVTWKEVSVDNSSVVLCQTTPVSPVTPSSTSYTQQVALVER